MANNINFVQLSSYTSPRITENSRLGWVEYGDDNNYFQYLIDRYNGSPTNNAVVSGVIDMIFGKGLDATDSAQNTEGYMQLRKLIKDSELKKVINDYYLLGNGAFQVIYNRDKSKIVEVYHMPVECLRAEKCNAGRRGRSLLLCLRLEQQVKSKKKAQSAFLPSVMVQQRRR